MTHTTQRRAVPASYLSLALFSSLTVLHAATLEGTIQDAQRRSVPQAAIRVYRHDGSLVTSLESDRVGHYRIASLPGGDYLVSVSKSEFQENTLNVTVTNSDRTELDVPLEINGLSQTVVVTAEDAAQTSHEVSKAVTTIDHSEIVNRNQYSIADLLRTMPSVQLLNSGGPGQLTTIRIRGLRSDAAAVLIDGQRFRDSTTTQADASSFVSSLNVVDPDRIEILRGSGSSLYGTNAVGGAINIVSDSGGGPTHGQVQAEGGSLGLFRGRGDIGGAALGDRLRYSAGLLHLNVTSGIDGQDAARSTGVQGAITYSLTPKIQLGAHLWGSDDFAQLNTSPSTEGIPASAFPASGVIDALPNQTYVPDLNDPDYRRSSRFANASLSYRQTLTSDWYWQTNYQRVHTNRIYQNGPLGPGFQPSYSDFSQYRGDVDTLNLRTSRQFGSRLTVTAGYEWEHEHYFDNQDDRTPDPSRIVERTNASQISNAAFFSSQLSLLSHRLQVSVSGRAQYFNLSQPTFHYAGITNTYDNLPLPRPPAAYTGDVSVAYYNARSNTKFRAHAGNAFRAPSLYERFGAGFYNDFVTGKPAFSPYGDPRLAPDRYNSFDTGVEQSLLNERLLLSATLFYTRIVHVSEFDFNGLIQPASDPYGRSSGYYNGSGGISRGAEFIARSQPIKKISTYGTYTYTNVNSDRDTSVPGYFGAIGVAKHTVGFVAMGQWTRRFDSTLDFYHYSSLNAPLYAGFSPRIFRFPGFSRTGLVSSYRFWNSEAKFARVYINLDNLFNRTYYEAGFLASGITATAGLQYSF